MATLLTISKWVYFFIVVPIHRKIREYEIGVEIDIKSENNQPLQPAPTELANTADIGETVDHAKNHSNVDRLQEITDQDFKAKELSKLKKWSFVTNFITGISSTILIYFYFHGASTVCISATNYHYERLSEAQYSLYQLESISSLAISVVMMILCSVMMWRLRKLFDSIFKDYGCLLWTALAILLTSTSLAAILRLLDTYSDSWYEYWVTNASLKRNNFYAAFLELVTFVIPILAKLATLIFGYIRNKDKEAQNNGTQAENNSVADDD